MYRSLYTERSQIPGVWIVITILSLVVVSSVTFENFKNVYAAEDLNVKVTVGEDDIERGEMGLNVDNNEAQ